MNRQNRSQLVLGLLLVLMGGWLAVSKTFPPLAEFVSKIFEWPYTMLWIGGLILVLGLFTGNPGMAVPASVVAGIGVIFYVNEAYAGGQSAWIYSWTLIPGFVGIGSILAGILGEDTRQNLRRGWNSLVFSALAFLLFASIFGGLNLLGNYGPAILLIVVGVWLLGRSLWKSFFSR